MVESWTAEVDQIPVAGRNPSEMADWCGEEEGIRKK